MGETMKAWMNRVPSAASVSTFGRAFVRRGPDLHAKRH